MDFLVSNQHRFVWLTAIILFCSSLQGHADTSSGEFKLKAAFIFNFAKYVEWPNSSFSQQNEFCIATLGRSPLDKELAKLSGKIIQNRNVVFRQFNSIEETAQCQVLFISRSELGKQTSIADFFRNTPVLTLSDKNDFSKSGVMLSLVDENGKIVFDVNIQEMHHARLKPNPQLLRLARNIYGRPSNEVFKP